MKTDNSAHIIVGLGFGDEGKGTMTDFLCREHNADLVIRYNGGAQAGHNVVTEDGKHHNFSQIGSGAFVSGVRTLLSQYMLWNPISLAHEASELSPKINEHALQNHFIDCRAPVITPFHVASNRLKEWVRGQSRHGSCGKGVGELAYDLANHPDDVIYAKDIHDETKTSRILSFIQARKKEEITRLGIELDEVPYFLVGLVQLFTSQNEIAKIADAYKTLSSYFNIIAEKTVNRMIQNSRPVFEGAQGVLLDEWHGFHPYTTWSSIVPINAFKIISDCRFVGNIEVVGVTRSYSTRHGKGPFVTENTIPDSILLSEHNKVNEWQGPLRIGCADGVMLRYSLDCIRGYFKEPISLAITHLDVFDHVDKIPFCNSYAEKRNDLDSKDRILKFIKPNFTKDLSYQESVAKMLFNSEPIVDRYLYGPEDVVEQIEQTSNLQVKYLSFGASPIQKTVIGSGFLCESEFF